MRDLTASTQSPSAKQGLRRRLQLKSGQPTRRPPHLPMKSASTSWIGRALAAALAVAVLLLGACAALPRDVPRPLTTAWAHPLETPLGRAYAEQWRSGDGYSGFRLLSSGMEALGARAGLADSAVRTLDLQYYLVRHDATSQLLLYRVMRAALRGVRVRLLVDDLYAAGRDFDLAAFAAHPNVQVRVFNPFAHRGALGLPHLLEFLADPGRLNRRMHNKLWIADNALAVVGGRNLGDEYFDAQESVNFCDLDLLAVGPVVAQASRSFDEYWNDERSMPIGAFADAPDASRMEVFERAIETALARFHETRYAAALREGRFARDVRDGRIALELAPAQAVYDRPDKPAADGNSFIARMSPLLASAQREILFISPYFIPDARAVAMFGAAVARGARVRVFTNSLASTDVPVVHAGYARVRRALLRAGVELNEMRPEARVRGSAAFHFGSGSGASLHAKAVVVDGRHVLLGSMNMDPRSRRINTEVGVLLDSQAIAAEVAAVFEQGVRPDNAFRVVFKDSAAGTSGQLQWLTQENGNEIVYSSEPLAGWWRRLYAAFAPGLCPRRHAVAGVLSHQWPCMVHGHLRGTMGVLFVRQARATGVPRGEYRLYRCRTIMNCTEVCPKGLSPSHAVERIRLAMARDSS